MPLLSERDQQTVRKHLSGIQRPVTLAFFTQTIGAPETALITRQVLDEVAGLHDQITVEEINFVLEKERAALYGVDRIPAVVVLADGADTGMRFFGAPAGYEFMSLVESILLAGTDDPGLEAASQALIASHVTGPLDIQVFVTPT
jgi:alkyl hydroperoxide reductase subunit AhpF